MASKASSISATSIKQNFCYDIFAITQPLDQSKHIPNIATVYLITPPTNQTIISLFIQLKKTMRQYVCFRTARPQ